jgi:AcrR family transcriptional regulator
MWPLLNRTAISKRYRDFEEVFENAMRDCYRSYQLIRNVLAAHAMACSFCVCLDARRPDLLEEWYAVALREVGAPENTPKVLTWQELSEALPAALLAFLDVKYGIVPPERQASPVPGMELREE